jgi:5,6,7,8-tetrahydromethanopterin hydro-lyase
VKPLTLFVTKAAPANDTPGVMIWGAAQAAVAS